MPSLTRYALKPPANTSHRDLQLLPLSSPSSSSSASEEPETTSPPACEPSRFALSVRSLDSELLFGEEVCPDAASSGVVGARNASSSRTPTCSSIAGAGNSAAWWLQEDGDVASVGRSFSDGSGRTEVVPVGTELLEGKQVATALPSSGAGVGPSSSSADEVAVVDCYDYE